MLPHNIVTVILLLIVPVYSELVSETTNNVHSEKSDSNLKSNTGRNFSLRNAFSCALSLDLSCLLDRAEDYVDIENKHLWREADELALQARSSRAKNEEYEAPSSLITTISHLLLEVPEIVKEGFNGLLRSNKEEDEEDEVTNKDNKNKNSTGEKVDEEDDEEDEEDEEDDDEDGGTDETEGDTDEDNDNQSRFMTKPAQKRKKKCDNRNGNECTDNSVEPGNNGSNPSNINNAEVLHQGFSTRNANAEVGDSRGKKKKKKRTRKKAILKLLLLGVVLKAKLLILLKILAAKLQVKFFLIALANLLINGARFWWDLKKNNHDHPQKVIYYEHAQHQHHYDGDEWDIGPGGGGGGGGGGGYWSRTYNSDEDSNKSAQDMAYAQQMPLTAKYSSRIRDQPESAWSLFG